MIYLSLLPCILSCLMMAAHAQRASFPILALVCLAVPLSLLIKKRWVIQGMQILLVFFALEWVRTLSFLVQVRIENHMPWDRLALILSGVTLFTLLSALPLFHARIKAHYPAGSSRCTSSV